MNETLFKQVTNESLSEVMAYCRVLKAKDYEVAFKCGKEAGIIATAKDAKERWMNH